MSSQSAAVIDSCNPRRVASSAPFSPALLLLECNGEFPVFSGLENAGSMQVEPWETMQTRAVWTENEMMSDGAMWIGYRRSDEREKREIQRGDEEH